MLRLNKNDIKKVEKIKLDLNFHWLKNNVCVNEEHWNLEKMQVISQNVEEIVKKKEQIGKNELFGLIKNQSNKWGGTILMAGKLGAKNKALVVWAYDCLSSTFVGTNIEELAKTAKADWASKFIKQVEVLGVPTVLKRWWESEQSLESKALIEFMRTSHETSWTREFKASFIPDHVRKCMDDRFTDPWMMIRQVTAYRNKKRDKERKEHFKTKSLEKHKILEEISKQCLIKSETSCYFIYKGGHKEWMVDGGEILLQLEEGIKRMPVIGLDSEGNGSWYQLAWVGMDGIEAAVLGLRFFPVILLKHCYWIYRLFFLQKELMEILERPGVYIVGVDVHSELKELLGRKTGWSGVDLSTLTRDLPASNLKRPGLGEMILEATGVSVRHIKCSNEKKDWNRFAYIRQRGWEEQSICHQKVVYAALDPAMSLVIVYNYVRHHALRYQKLDRKSEGITIKSLLSEALDNIVDRKYAQAKEHQKDFNKNLATQEAALHLSKRITEDENINLDEEDGPRRERLYSDIRQRVSKEQRKECNGKRKKKKSVSIFMVS
jgi:hypothetical protein